jgi:two-component system cell cycle response regulator
VNYTSEQEGVVSILIVEDNPDHATLAKAPFEERDNWDIEVASTLEQAFSIICRKDFDVVLLDYVLPDGFGLDLLEWIKQDCAVVLMTSQGSEQVAVDSFRRGVLNYVVKDCLFRHNLAEAVDEVLRKRQPAEAEPGRWNRSRF